MPVSVANPMSSVQSRYGAILSAVGVVDITWVFGVFFSPFFYNAKHIKARCDNLREI